MKNELYSAMANAGQNLLDALNPERNYIPYWCMDIEDGYVADLHESWPQHNLGRWWDAMLRLEAATGFVIPAKVEAAMLENLELFFDNPDNLCFQPIGFYDKPFPLELHSLRESLLALHALVKYRGSAWAAIKGRQMLETIDRIYIGNGLWDVTKLDYANKVETRFSNHFDPVGSNGRLLEALVWYFQATQDDLALSLAKQIAEYHYENSIMQDGSINHTSKPNHTHSYFNMLQGLLLYGQETCDRSYIERVKLAYDKTVKWLVKESGFTAHDLGTDHMGETSSGGDATQLALWLADEGYIQYADDAERIIRARTLPSQLNETPELKPAAEDGKDCHRDLTRRCIGGFCMHKHPHSGKINTTDVTAHCLHALIDAYKHIAVRKNGSMVVLLHFDYKDDAIEIKSTRGVMAQLEIRLLVPSPLFVRIPGWTDKSAVAADIDGKPISPEKHGRLAYFSTLCPGRTLRIQYALPEKTVTEMTDGVEYTFKWRGDDVVGISPNTQFYPFYQTLDSSFKNS